MGKWSRRAFIGAGVAAGGALVVGIAVRPGNPIDGLSPLLTDGENEQLLNAWVKVDTDNIVTAVIPHVEMGQGVYTALAQMLADEMDADWSKVQILEAPADMQYVSDSIGRDFLFPNLQVPALFEPTVAGGILELAQAMGLQFTGGSYSVRATGQRAMRTAGAAAREMLVAAAASEWQVPAAEITTADSMIVHARSGKSEPFATFALAAAEQSLPAKPKLKSPENYKIMGQPKARHDIPEKVDGSAVFGIDADVPGMKYAAVKAPPVIGATVESMDATTAKTMPGVLQILNMGDFVAVVADGYWQAQQALGTIDAQYSKTEGDSLDQDAIFARYASHLDEAGEDGGDMQTEAGDVAKGFAGAATKVEAEYKVPFLAHATMEPMNCTAWVRDGKCDVWSGHQAPVNARQAAADAAGLPFEDVTYHNAYLGGGFGRRSDSDAIIMATRIAKATGYPVKMIWSREEDTAQDHYRPSATSRFRGGLDKDGKAVSWDNIHTHLFDPADAPTIPHYNIASHRIRKVDVPMHLRFGPWRSVDHSQHGFFIESFVDEMAHAAGKDGYAFRRELLAKSPRHLKVLDTAAKMSGWGSALPEKHGHGIAFVPSFGSIVAQVAEVDMSGPKPRVTKVYVAADPGFVVNPDGFTAQMESGIVYGLTAALYGDITIKDGAVQQSNFHDYPMLRIDEMPEVEVTLINGDHERLGGGGEPGLPPIAPAVTNAIFAATGKRVRELPIAKHDFA
ncbi:xanthine dehydrogenase family protein molybdopterin-binding subunit [Parasphingorhabdus flavimaris]|uniref:xanthine dehydrogenase family protein molybdopterin-binding subunit n=1 Tax=Parasphingorhabdus flavimaris TaxID=266812 RepID=UPI0030015DD6